MCFWCPDSHRNNTYSGTMGQKLNCNPLKLASLVAYFQKSRVAHSIKDLEKALPSVASINGVQVKEYLQSLQDENKINVEKIGSGNWYWSFTSQDQKVRQKALDEAQAAYEKAKTVNSELNSKLAEAAEQRASEEDMLDDAGESREDVIATKAVLEKEVQALKKQLTAYSDSDPTELERKRGELIEHKDKANVLCDEVYSMEGWFTNAGLDREALAVLRMKIYGDQFDAEEGVLKEYD
ncbi:hypothetical protein LTR78_010012 [Recurvomyces mirabilis]|uniref:Mnd1 HTH domain-containing protein n=1 Tax=Recurvomyces mirabilis TaxID=574656 RepID=A0AAE0WH38_9PEZI|nr:hypothetical protein LTR78_010012 [Recurvomyces mirabilis]KAK5149793.1 hypothetical protein LTS14_010614 [Recurvomyces mirabilis]